jgi:hypothetical protein
MRNVSAVPANPTIFMTRSFSLGRKRTRKATMSGRNIVVVRMNSEIIASIPFLVTSTEAT